jgi:tetratricopeptide (TPR) repeat protein
VATVSEVFALAWQHHQAGSLLQAEQLYRQILAADPSHADTHHCLGVLAYQLGRLDQAVISIRQALSLRPDFVAAHYAQAMALADLGKAEEAVAQYRQALRLNPNYVEAHNNLGNVLLGQGKVEDAIIHWKRALILRPDAAEIHNNLGNAMELLGQYEEAVAHCQEAIRLNPNLAEAHNNLGNVLVRQEQVERAIGCYRQALRLNPNFHMAYNNLGNALIRQNQFEAAVVCYHQAIRLVPRYAEAISNLGNARFLQGSFGEAQACYDQALRLDARDPETHFNQALLWLLQGKWKEGLIEYEARWQTRGFPRYAFDKPRWDGSTAPSPSSTLLLLAEQGLGDTLLSVRYVSLVRELGWKVILQCQAPLTRLLTSMPGIERVVPRETPLPAFDAYLPLLSLPGIFGTTPNTVPAVVPYMRADSALVEHWRQELNCGSGLSGGTSAIAGSGPARQAGPIRAFKLGIAWQGTRTFTCDRQRSIPLAQFAPLARVNGVHLISLQKGPGTEQLHTCADMFTVVDLARKLDEASGPFMDTAAVMNNLDLVISSDTAVAHLAGALGVPVWVALPVVPDWRWLLEREDTPWYPTMRLFRQTRQGHWEDVFERMASEITKLACAFRAK